MDEEYARNVEEVMAYLAAKGRSRRTVRGHGECYSMLASYLRENELPYSEANAWKWFEGIADKLDRTRRNIWAGALCKVADLYATGEIGQFHYRAPKKEDRLHERNRQVVEDYCRHLHGSGLAPATVENHRAAAVRFLLSLQECGVDFVADASYDDVIRILLACEDMTYRAKTDYRGKMRSMLTWLNSVGLACHGFTLLVDAMSLKKGYCWNDVGQGTIDGLLESQAEDGGRIALEDYLTLVGDLADEHRASGYSHGPVCSVMHYGNLLYLFMDVHGLLYDPRVGRAWVESMARSLSYGELASCRRVVMLLEQSFYGVAHDLRRPFVFRKTLRDRLPKWCEPQVDAFLGMKAMEGWERSTLVMFRTCVCRFCIFLDGVGVTGFGQVTANHVKRFNVEDRHETPEGKNAFNSRIRQFLEWLGLRGELTNPNLFLALPNVAAPREDLVVTLTPSEQRGLESELASGDATSLRDKAMLQLGLHMGVRACDVVGLTADGIGWHDSTVRFVQAKTGYEVSLPMPTDVGNALYRYIVEERPESGERTVFLRSKAPYAPVGAGVAQQSLARALPDRCVPRSGFHSLRKTFASNMLGSGAEPAQVAEALGHRGLDNVRRYLHLDEERMRFCGLSLGEAGLVPEGGVLDAR
ncbi:MAG: tyrosine-type recombinase/integrase [Atopobiaceae bacterium]|nr:tyrosine-type recombinase/integrase [Atopobiaceae bacterium]